MQAAIGNNNRKRKASEIKDDERRPQAEANAANSSHFLAAKSRSGAVREGIVAEGEELETNLLQQASVVQRPQAPRMRFSVHTSQSIAVTTVFCLGLAFVPAAWADPASDACAALVDARGTLYSMISAKDKSAQDALNAKVQAASAKLDSVLAGMTGANAKVTADFKAVWDQFKATRENEIIPAIYKGNADDAKKIASGIQSERLSKMWSIMSCKVR